MLSSLAAGAAAAVAAGAAVVLIGVTGSELVNVVNAAVGGGAVSVVGKAGGPLVRCRKLVVLVWPALTNFLEVSLFEGCSTIRRSACTNDAGEVAEESEKEAGKDKLFVLPPPAAS